MAAIFQVFYDGACPLCAREIAVVRALDRKRRIELTDIAAEGFRAENYGKTMEALMAEIHGRTPDGTWVTGVDVFRHMYAALGLGWLVRATELPGVRRVLDVAYRAFARNRLRLTGRCDDGRCRVRSTPQCESASGVGA